MRFQGTRSQGPRARLDRPGGRVVRFSGGCVSDFKVLSGFRGSVPAPGSGRIDAWIGTRSRMRNEPRLRPRHQLDHAVPTVIHDPEQNLPVLARWLRHAMENPTRFWSLVAGLVIVVTGLAIFSSG